MEGLQTAYRSAMAHAQESTAKLSSLVSSLEKSKTIESASSSSGVGSSADQSVLLLTRPPR
ncbi:hypothetical protein F511_06675 [Dorcoceras hygrometricum]|uniref:Uncharacterized protein n=1 Tax=Dorcoceras hygrometricum TaxID=472368 RepID=A0A2Z7AZN6_9LAMI|nr:hypothetical protein F511_06675 [Dorcoceras hygrometricum]